MTFDPYLRRWNLVPDGEPIHTNSSDLLPVRLAGKPAMLKVARVNEEEVGHRLMVWWNGEGAARVLRHDGEAALLERVEGDLSLAEMVRAGQDDEASRILCATVAVLHARQARPWPELTPLERWFRTLEELAPQVGGVLATSLETARHLFREPRHLRPLHGDIHHGNVLHSRERGWLAIDPKGLIGERGFDYANIFCNPDPETATRPGRLARQTHVVAAAAELDQQRLLQWVLAYAGLSAAWHLEDDEPDLAAPTLEVARIAAAELGF
ncbi:aminoglycoside phosphotransferase family protein [Deinococcus aetherius]|uniref:aminoglycoside phosphotransferase family protein n=1 Tax=Deinococcus aetherius TaxID=200252 RepID=UPI002232B728|nr:aminoglycoside phosphotransferase family protein [Deinococcus aetherius]